MDNAPLINDDEYIEPINKKEITRTHYFTVQNGFLFMQMCKLRNLVQSDRIYYTVKLIVLVHNS